MTNDDARPTRRWWTIAAIGATTITVILLTLVPDAAGGRSEDIACLVCGSRGLADLIANVLLFVPLGAALRAHGWPTRHAVLAALALSIAIELVQFSLPGRSPSARDVVTNGFGAWIGALALTGRTALGRRGRGAALRFGAALTVAPLGVLLGASLLDVPPLPHGDPLFGQWAPRFATMGHWDGTLETVTVDGRPLPSARLVDGTLPTLSEPISLRGSAGAPATPFAPIFGLADETGDHLVLLSQERADLVLYSRRWSTLFRLDAPVVRFTDALAGIERGAPLAIRVTGLHTASPCLIVADRDAACAPAPAAGSAWMLLVADERIPAPARAMLGALLLAMCAVPAGAASVAVGRGAAASGLALTAIGVLTAAQLGGSASPTALEWLGLAAGLPLGRAASQRALRRSPEGTVRST